MTIKKEIIYPIFLECCNIATDTFWKNIFEDLAYGKCVYGTYISKDFLCCSYKEKSFSYKIEKKNIEELYNDIYNLLTKKLGILSQNEKIKKRIQFYDIEEKIKSERKEWANIRKRNLKDLLIERYVIDIKKKYNLTISQTKYLLSVIFISIIFKVINTKDIIYENGKIINIKGICFKKNQIILKRDIYNLKINFSPEIIIDKKIMSEQWTKYLESLRKYVSV